MTAVTGAKVRLRADVRERLARLPGAERDARSERVVAALDGLAEVRSADRLLLHRSLPSEVSVDRLLGAALARGQVVLAPRVDGPRLALALVEFETEWRRSTLGVLEPSKGRPLAIEALGRGSTVIVVPGLAFDERGRRLGRGGGHYDRLLAAARAAGDVLAIAVAFELQIVPEVPIERHDESVDRIVTEDRVLVARRLR